ncbi:hypothetical protein M758_UG318700 [Ceratodon purpureus]|nr:hypothetical protein M758_UG318700 [Ceratodon purpureus]
MVTVCSSINPHKVCTSEQRRHCAPPDLRRNSQLLQRSAHHRPNLPPTQKIPRKSTRVQHPIKRAGQYHNRQAVLAYAPTARHSTHRGSIQAKGAIDKSTQVKLFGTAPPSHPPRAAANPGKFSHPLYKNIFNQCTKHTKRTKIPYTDLQFLEQFISHHIHTTHACHQFLPLTFSQIHCKLLITNPSRFLRSNLWQN